MKYIACLVFVSAISMNFAMAAGTLTLSEYLSQVKQSSSAFSSAREAQNASAYKAQKESELLTMPQAFVQAQGTRDKKPRLTPQTSGTGLTAQNYSFGLQQQNRYGTSAKLSYSITHSDVEGLPSAFASISDTYTASPALEVKQSLWRNAFGHETQATQEAMSAASAANSFAKKFEQKNILVQAENAYWQLSLAREVIRIQKESLDRAQKIRDWNARRVNMSLADKADLLQAEAGLQMRRLELKAALDDEKTASRAFNSLREENGQSVPEALQSLSNKELELPADFKKMSEREDLVAAKYLANATQANADLAVEKTLPGLDVFASASLNGLDQENSHAMKDASGTKHTVYAVGVSFTTPLDFNVTKNLRSAYGQDTISAELGLKRKNFDIDKQWTDLNDSLRESKERLELTKKMSAVQKQKLTYEKERLYKGKTVTYQVLQFEIDYANAELGVVREESRLLGILANLKLFQDGTSL